MAYRDCYNCDGEGYVNDIECQLCSGSGLIKKYDWEDVPDADTSNFGSAIIYGEGKANEDYSLIDSSPEEIKYYEMHTNKESDDITEEDMDAVDERAFRGEIPLFEIPSEIGYESKATEGSEDESKLWWDSLSPEDRLAEINSNISIMGNINDSDAYKNSSELDHDTQIEIMYAYVDKFVQSQVPMDRTKGSGSDGMSEYDTFVDKTIPWDYDEDALLYQFDKPLGESKATEKAWSQMSPDERMVEFEYVGLSGIHFNEDHEENWAEYNYGDTDWNSLTPKMQDQLTKRGITEKYSKATENPFVGKNWVADDTPEQDDILGGRTIEEYLQEYNMTREEGERVASYAGMGLEELIQVGNFGEAKYHMDSDYNDAMMFESKATEDLSDFVRECPECGEKISINPNAYNQVVAGTGFDAGDHLFDHLLDKHGYSMNDAERATEGTREIWDSRKNPDWNVEDTAYGLGVDFPYETYSKTYDELSNEEKRVVDDYLMSSAQSRGHDPSDDSNDDGLGSDHQLTSGGYDLIHPASSGWRGESKAKEEYINTLDYFDENDNCRICGDRAVGSTQYTHLQKQHGINEELGGFGDFTNDPMGSWENKKSKEFNIGSTMICPICNKEIDVGNDEQYFGHDNTFHDSGTVPFAYKMEDHIADAHTPEEAGVEPWVYADGGSPPNGWMGNNQYQAFHQNFPEYSQDDAEMMNVSGRDDSYTSSGKRSSDKYKYGLDDGSDDYLFDEFGNFQ